MKTIDCNRAKSGTRSIQTRGWSVVILGLLTLFGAGAVRAQTVTALHDFNGTPNDGDGPFLMHLIQATDGYFYGTTISGGISNAGNVFRISSNGVYTNIYDFKSAYADDGQTAESGVIQGSDGNFYGTTFQGGSNFYGTIYKVTPAGVETNIHYFQGRAAGEGIQPFAALYQSTNGYFYGTTSAGGTRGYGTVFQIDSAGNFMTIYSFTNGLDGSDPYAGVVQGSDGYFYGTTFYGGASNLGTLYKVSMTGDFVPLHQFGANSNDGAYVDSGLILGSTGDFFGTTYGGGTNGDGTVFRLNSSGVLSYIYNFGNYTYDGLNPHSALTQGSDGYLYGTTYLGGTNGNSGTIFKIGPTGGVIYLHNFDAFAGDGAFPTGQLVEGYDGNYYGTTFMGGSNQIGVVYKLAYPPSTNNPNNPNITETGSSGTGANTTNNVVVSFAAIAGETYHLQYANSLPAPAWSNVPGVYLSNAIGGPTSISNLITTSVPERFYRLQVTP